MLVVPKSVKIQLSHKYLFKLSGSTGAKDARRTLMKLIPGRRVIESRRRYSIIILALDPSTLVKISKCLVFWNRLTWKLRNIGEILRTCFSFDRRRFFWLLFPLLLFWLPLPFMTGPLFLLPLLLLLLLLFRLPFFSDWGGSPSDCKTLSTL